MISQRIPPCPLDFVREPAIFRGFSPFPASAGGCANRPSSLRCGNRGGNVSRGWVCWPSIGKGQCRKYVTCGMRRRVRSFADGRRSGTGKWGRRSFGDRAARSPTRYGKDATVGGFRGMRRCFRVLRNRPIMPLPFRRGEALLAWPDTSVVVPQWGSYAPAFEGRVRRIRRTNSGRRKPRGQFFNGPLDDRRTRPHPSTRQPLELVSKPSAGQIHVAWCRGSRASNRVLKRLLLPTPPFGGFDVDFVGWGPPN